MKARHDRPVQRRDQDRETARTTWFVTILSLGLLLIVALWAVVFVLRLAPTIPGTL